MKFAALALAAWVLGPAPRLPELADAAAQEHARKAVEHWAADELAKASEELAKAYAIEPEPALLGAQGVVAQLRGDCGRAIELFDAYLETKPADKGAETARRRIRECGGEPSSNGAPAEPPAQPLDETPPPPQTLEPPKPVSTPAADEPPPPAQPWHRDRLGGALVGVGGVVLATGAGVLAGAFAVEGRAANPASHDMFVTKLRRASAMETSGYVLMGLGGALVVGGIARWATLARRSKR